MTDSPVFYSRNWLDAAAEVTVSSGDATQERLFDRDWDLPWSSDGEDSDANPATIEMEMMEDGIAISRVVDTVAVLGTNAKAGKVQYWDGSAYQDFTSGGSYSAHASETLIIAPRGAAGALVSTERIKLTIDTTQVADAEKEVGEILLLETFVDLGVDKGPVNFTQEYNAVTTEAEMSDGGRDVNLFRWAGSRTQRWRGQFDFVLLSQADNDDLFELVNRHVFTVRPEPDQRPERFFQVAGIMRPFREAYTSPAVKLIGYSNSLEVMEL